MNKKRIIYFSLVGILFVMASCAGAFFKLTSISGDVNPGNEIIPPVPSVEVEESREILQVPKENQEEIIWKTHTIDNSLTIDLPQGGEYPELFIQQDKDGGRFTPTLKGGKELTKFSYVGSIGFPAIYLPNGFQSIFHVYKATVDLKGSGLNTWIEEVQKNHWNPDFPISDLPKTQERNRSIAISQKDSELVYFHMPEPSDAGWYAYRNGSLLYLFSMGNSSVAVNGMNEGLWSRAMKSLSPQRGL